MKKVIIISMLLISGLATNAQCDRELSKRIKSKMTTEEVLLDEFKVKLNIADIDDPAPVAKFSIKFEERTKYRLRIENDTEIHNSTCIIRLFDNNRLLGTNYIDYTQKDYPFFDFKCTKPGIYHLFVTFKDGKEGCAVVIISEVI